MTMRSLSWLDPVVDRCGFGRYQLFLLIQTGATGFASAAIFVILGSMVSHLPLQKWGVSRAEATLLQSAIFVGVTLGTLVGGVFADRFGRRVAVLLSYILLVLSAVLLVTAQGYYPMVFACLLFGAVGGFALPAMNALLVEASPSNHRGELVCLSGMLWFAGELYGAACVWFLGATELPSLGGHHDEHGFRWRLCFVLGFLPAVPVVIYAFFYLEESARFLAAQGRFKEAQAVFVVMASTNRVQTPTFSPFNDRESQYELEDDVDQESAWQQSMKRLRMLTRYPLSASTGMLMILCIVCNFAYFGLIFALPQILQDQKGAVAFLGGASVQVLVVTLFKVPGIITALVLLRCPNIGHRSSLAVLLFLAALCAWSYPEFVSVGAMKAAFGAACCLKLATSAVFLILYVFILEVYPTQIRSTGMAICTMVGRVGSITSPIVHSYAVAYAGNSAYFLVIALCSLVAVGAAMLMPCDTKGRPLGDDGESNRLLSNNK